MTTTAAVGHRPRPDPDTRGGLRLKLAAAGVLILVVPFALLLLVVDHCGPLQRLDHDLAGRLNTFAFPHPGYVTFLKVVTTVGHPAVFEPVTVGVTVWLLARRQPRLAVWRAVTVFGGGLLSTIVKNAVGRKRPLLPHPVAQAISASFPSGHAIGSVVGDGTLGLGRGRRPAGSRPQHRRQLGSRPGGSCCRSRPGAAVTRAGRLWLCFAGQDAVGFFGPSQIVEHGYASLGFR